MTMQSPTFSTGGRVAVVGTLNVDLVWQVPTLPRPGQTILASAVERQFGGKGANQAVAAARQGARVRMAGAVGDDAEGREYREHLRREGIDGDYITTAAGFSGTAHVYVDAKGENLIVVDQGANAHIDPASLGRVVEGVDCLLVQLECPLTIAVEALRLAAACGVRSVLNASPSRADFPWGRHPIDTVIVNEHECRECFGRTPDDFWRAADAELRESLRQRAVTHLVITQGAAPTLHLAADVRHRVPTYHVEPRDTVGAGDMFAGTLVAKLAAGCDWEGALWHANVAAALSTLAIGAQTAMPGRADVEAAIERAQTTRVANAG
jgi:ribokinase